MKIRLAHGVLLIGIAMMLVTPSDRVLAQANPASTNETKAATPSASHNVGATKNRHWRHRGGTHPHYGSRRLRKPAS
ncbi:MAG: hypothetical protein JO000_12900 [Alphaproteobacteria bacterium]|nr:hypothetical protein [Alphaproteobacteria bacterium]